MLPALLALAAGLPLAGDGETPTLRELRAMLPPRDDPTEAVTLADLDGDGDLDLVAANAGKPDRLLRNGGDGVLVHDPAALPPDAAVTCAVEAGDVDGDGDLDLLLGTGALGGQNRLYLADGAGAFADATAQLPVDADGTEDVALGDVDGDGDLDALVGNDGEAGAHPSRLYTNDGAGVFVEALGALPSGALWVEDVALADVDADGDLDAVLVADGAQNRLYRNDGTGAFADATGALPADADESEALAVGDVDGDGDLDLVVGNSGAPLSGSQDRLYANEGDGTFVDATAALLPLDDDDTEGLALGDVDGDGDLDLVRISYGAPDRLLANDGAGAFLVRDGALPDLPTGTAAALGDVDGDRDVDLVVAHFGQRTRLLLNDGAGAFLDPLRATPTAWWYATAAAAGDVDGDGDLDVVVGDALAGDHLLLGDGAGGLAEAPAVAAPGGTLDVRLADLDGDGDLDAALASAGQSRLWLGDGGGGFVETTAGLPADPQPTHALAVGDVDGDGDLDLLLGDDAAGGLWLGAGDGAFVAATLGPPDAERATRAIAVGDLDGDGDLDALLAEDGPEVLLLGDGAGGFADASAALPPAADRTGAVVLADLDGDGDLDALLGNGLVGGEPDRLLLGDGAGGLVDGSAGLPPDAGESASLAAGDVDGDGDLDVLVGGGASAPGPDRLLIGDAADGIGEVPLEAPGAQRTRACLLADLDGDGDADALLASDPGRVRVLTSLATQLARRGLPRPGQPLALDLAGPPGAPWLVAHALAPGSQPAPPLGTLLLDPATLHVWPTAGALDATGNAALVLFVPSSPTLVGAVVWWQPVLGDPLALGSLERTEVTEY